MADENKIICISNHDFMLGGGEHSFFDLLSHLPKPWSVLAITPGEGELTASLKRKGIDTQVIPLPPIRPWYVCNILATLSTYFNLCRGYRPVLIYTNGSRAALYGGIIGRILTLPVIWHCRVANPDIYLDFILRRLSSKIIANSRATAKRFKKFSSSKVEVIHNGVNLEWLRAESVQKPNLIGDTWKVVLVVARVSRWKRHDLALTAFEQVAAKEPNAHLVCVGAQDALEPEWWKYLQDRSYQSKVSGRIHWVGQVEDVRPWYRSASVLLLCSECEPFGRVLVEAMACGVPVIATRSGGVPEIVRHYQTGIMVSPGEAGEMVGAITEVLKNDSLRQNLSRLATKRANVFSLSTHVERMIRVFKDTSRN